MTGDGFSGGRFSEEDYHNGLLGRYVLDCDLVVERQVIGETMRLHRGDELIMTGVSFDNTRWMAEFCHVPTLYCLQLDLHQVNRFTRRRFDR